MTVLTTRQAAELLGCSSTKARTLARDGEPMGAYRLGRKWFFVRDRLEAWRDEQIDLASGGSGRSSPS